MRQSGAKPVGWVINRQRMRKIGFVELTRKKNEVLRAGCCSPVPKTFYGDSLYRGLAEGSTLACTPTQ
jgi:hypothetical protein